MKKLYTLITCLFLSTFAGAQQWQQYFDGNDTDQLNSVFIWIDSTGGNTWQIGPPQKTLFNSPATSPNVLITDTINAYPVNDTSSFEFAIFPFTTWGVLAIQWKQKLDLDSAQDIGIIEYSVDNRVTWNTVFDSPHTYNFYGWDSINYDTLANGIVGFTARDTSWSDMWLCFDMTWLASFNDSIHFRYTIMSDSINNNSEGWMIDNLLVHMTMFHSAKGIQSPVYMNVFPSVTTGVVYIETMHLQEYHIIENIQLIDVNGKVVKQWAKAPTKFRVDISDQPNGSYFLQVTTNLKTETFPVILQK